MDIALYQPDIPQNTGTILRLGACMGVDVHIIEPAGFPFSEKALKRAGMDYVEKVVIRRHMDWDAFSDWRRKNRRRLVLLSTKAATFYPDLTYRRDDILLLGQESSGVPEAVHMAADERVLVPMRPGLRSLNVAVAASMVLGEALRQIDGFPFADQAEG